MRVHLRHPEKEDVYFLSFEHSELVGKLEVFTEDIPRAAYVNSDGVTAVSGC